MCHQCEKNPVYEFTNKRKLCAKCFIRYFQKKVFYTIRKFKMIRPEEIISYKKNNDFRSVVLKDVLDFFAKKAGIEIVNGLRKKGKIAVSDTLDVTSNLFVSSLFDKEKKDLSPVVKNTIKPLYLFLDREVLLYAKIRKLQFKEGKIKTDKISLFIDELEKNHPEVKRAIVNSYLGLYC
jgi:hypothetical protein